MNTRFSLWITLVIVLALLVGAPWQVKAAGISSAPGNLDTSFSGDGKATGGWAAFDDGAHAVAIQRDGKIVMAGYTEYSDGDEDFMVLRYNADGSPDSSFGFMGMVMTSFDSLYSDRANAVAIQPDGKIVAAGFVAIGNGDIAVARYNSNGSLDTTFDGDGKAVISIGSSEDNANALVIQPDGKIVLVGYSIINNKVILALARLNNNGSLDTTFDLDGKITTDIGVTSAYSYGRAVALQSNGNIVVAGFSYSTTHDIVLAIYTAMGGLISINITDVSVDEKAFSVAVRPDDKIVVGGVTVGASGYDLMVARYHSDGWPDSSFGVNGISSVDVCGDSEQINAIALQPDGMILAAGECGVYPTYDFILARFQQDGGLDSSFDGDGKTMTDFSGNPDRGNAIALQPDGKVIVAGEVTVGSQTDFGLARYWGNSYLYLPALRK